MCLRVTCPRIRVVFEYNLRTRFLSPSITRGQIYSKTKSILLDVHRKNRSGKRERVGFFFLCFTPRYTQLAYEFLGNKVRFHCSVVKTMKMLISTTATTTSIHSYDLVALLEQLTKNTNTNFGVTCDWSRGFHSLFFDSHFKVHLVLFFVPINWENWLYLVPKPTDSSTP